MSNCAHLGYSTIELLLRKPATNECSFFLLPVQNFRQSSYTVVVHLEDAEFVELIDGGRDEGQEVAVHIQVGQLTPPTHALRQQHQVVL